MPNKKTILEDDQNLEEAKATGEDSESADAIQAAGGSVKMRLADKKKKFDPKADEIEDDQKTPQGKHDYGMKEAIEGVFEGEDLTEDFKTKATAIFETAVHERVQTEIDSLQEKFETDLDEQVDSAVTEIVENLNNYLELVVEKWVKENRVSVESNIKVEMAESLIENMRNMMTEHSISIDEADMDVISDLEEKVQKSSDRYNSKVNELIEANEQIEILQREIVFKTVCEDLTDTQVDKLATLSEGLSYSDPEEYAKKLSVLKKNYFTETKVVTDETEYLEEDVDAEKRVPVLDRNIAAYSEKLDRLFTGNS